MKSTTSFLFPGQGSQYIGMQQLTENHKINDGIYNISNEILGYDIMQIVKNGPIEKLNQTIHTQPAIFIQSIIHDKLIKSTGILPNSVAGHSLGEFSALVSSEVLTFNDALNIIKIRAKEMHNAGKNNPGTMAAVIGASQSQLKEICNQSGIVVPANYNTKSQIVISGDIKSIKEAIETAKSLGIRRCIPLKVSGAFHSPLMKEARISLEKVINSINFNDAKVPVYQNVSPIPIVDSNEIKFNIIKQLENSVKWNDTIINMYEDNYNKFIEIGPGKVLTNLNNKILSEDFISDYSENIISNL